MKESIRNLIKMYDGYDYRKHEPVIAFMKSLGFRLFEYKAKNENNGHLVFLNIPLRGIYEKCKIIVHEVVPYNDSTKWLLETKLT